MAAVRSKAIAVNRIGKIVAKIVAGVATSHVPAIGAAIDNGKAGLDAISTTGWQSKRRSV